MRNALIVFVRPPEWGKVKTRLAATLGNDAALMIYQKLLDHTLLITAAAGADKYIFYAGPVVTEDQWSREGFFKGRQADGDLGIRMQAAFETVFEKGYTKAFIIGSDCYELTTEIIETAFLQLQKNDVVIGPALDGGYYLLGMKQCHTALFQNRNWSTASVFEEAVHTIEALGLCYHTLPTLTDVDEAADVPSHWRLP